MAPSLVSLMPSSAFDHILSPDLRRRKAILDSNLLVLLVTASVDLALLKTFKRVKNYEPGDARLLLWLLGQFSSTVTTSYALAEASNLAGELSGWRRQQWYEGLARFARVTSEAHVPTALLTDHDLFVPFGVTDAALGILSEEHVLITAEYRLSGRLAETGRYVLNFNHLRPLWMLH